MGRALLMPTKTDIARTLGISRQSLYYKPKREALDMELKNQIESVMTQNPSYGHKRIALHLKMNKKRILRVMKKYGLKPHRRRVRRPEKNEDIGKAPLDIPNLVAIQCPIAVSVIWVSDFTYLKYRGKFIYFAVIEDLFSREIVGFAISRFHNRFLVMEALEDALTRNPFSGIIHSDQGSEYGSEEYQQLLAIHLISPSMSEKASPWQNGYQESFFSHFKVDFGEIDRFEDLSELIEAIYLHIYYYNNERIHTSLKMAPSKFKQIHLERLSKFKGT